MCMHTDRQTDTAMQTFDISHLYVFMSVSMSFSQLITTKYGALLEQLKYICLIQHYIQELVNVSDKMPAILTGHLHKFFTNITLAIMIGLTEGNTLNISYYMIHSLCPQHIHLYRYADTHKHT